MPLQNRVTPEMQIVAEPWRCDFMGNRGGRIHDPKTKMLIKRKWASKRWISCVTKFKNRQRNVMGNSYTELFFLDEVTALAAGHRPCFECRRKAANEFSSLWVGCFGKHEKSLADEMDKRIHAQRTSHKKTLSKAELNDMPDGTTLKINGVCYAKKHGYFLEWSGEGYKISALPQGEIHLLTPPSIVSVLEAGYEPKWHNSALLGVI